jgi:branched-chain amino acid transport system substrate-binding protein
MRQSLTLGLAFGLGLAFALPFADGASAQIKLGVGGPMTGGSAAFGAQLKNGTEQAVEDINAAGGILGQKIQIFIGDDRADPKEGVSPPPRSCRKTASSRSRPPPPTRR